MVKLFCDRCNRLITPGDDNFSVKEGTNLGQEYDLCFKCWQIWLKVFDTFLFRGKA